MTGRNAREEERLRSVHLGILVLLSVAILGLCLVTFFMRWSEVWMIPLLIAGLAACWAMQIGDRLSPGKRLWVFAAIGWTGILLYGVQPSSLFDVSILAAYAMLLFAQADDRRIIHVSLGIYVFCLFRQVMLLRMAGDAADPSVPARLFSHAACVLIVYIVSLSMIEKRKADLAADEREVGELRAAQRRTEDFLSGISADLRLPVRTVIESALAGIRNGQDEREKENAANVLDAGRRLKFRVEDLLDYMEIETGELQVAEEDYKISRVLNDVVADLALYEKPDLPDVLLDVEPAIPARLTGDGRLVGRIVKQVLGNAIKFTRTGGIYMHVYPDFHDDDTFNLCFDVQDTGDGIRRRELERVRTSAYQADENRTRRAGGLGLGFPIVNGMLRAMHGFINITSVPGEGTKVHLSIPQKAAGTEPCMKLTHPETLRVAFYQDPGKFAVPVIRDYYAQLVYHIIRGFRVTLQRVTTQEDLQELLADGTYTHLFTADEEYGRDPVYFETLAKTMHVIVVAKSTFRVPPDSNVTVLLKPLYTFPLIAVLNAETPADARAILNWKERHT